LIGNAQCETEPENSAKVITITFVIRSKTGKGGENKFVILEVSIDSAVAVASRDTRLSVTTAVLR